MAPRTVDGFILDVRARVAAPAAASDGLQSDSELLQLANQELRTEIADLLVSMRSEYWARYADQSIVSGTATYRIPDRAIGNALHDVFIRDASGNEYNATQIPASERHRYANGSAAPGHAPFGFVLEEGKVRLFPTPSASSVYTLRLYYYQRPPQLVTVSACWGPILLSDLIQTDRIEAIATVPSATFIAGAYLDYIRGDGMHETIVESLEIDAVIGGVEVAFVGMTTLNTQIPDSSRTNTDYVALEGQSPYVPVPEAVYPCVVAATCRAYCEAIGDRSGIEAAHAMYLRKVDMARRMMRPRVDNEQVRPIGRHTSLRRGQRQLGWRS